MTCRDACLPLLRPGGGSARQVRSVHALSRMLWEDHLYVQYVSALAVEGALMRESERHFSRNETEICRGNRKRAYLRNADMGGKKICVCS